MIRLQRVGRRKDPAFRVVVTQKKQGAGRKYIEMLGSYMPKSGAIELQADRIKEWISKGAQPSGTVHNMLVSRKIIDGKKINVLPKKTVPKKDDTSETGSSAAASGGGAGVTKADETSATGNNGNDTSGDSSSGDGPGGSGE